MMGTVTKVKKIEAESVDSASIFAIYLISESI